MDLRTQPPEVIDYFVVICARESEPWGTGHTFVVWLETDRRSGEIHSQGYGFYPAVDRVVMRLFSGAGVIRDESTRPASVKPWLLTHRLIMQVDRDAFEASLAVKDRWQQAGYSYHLLSRNCTHFAHDVVQSLGPATPKPVVGERPAYYLTRLMNRQLPVPTERVATERVAPEPLPAIMASGSF